MEDSTTYVTFMLWATGISAIVDMFQGSYYKNKGRDTDAIYSLVWSSIFITIHFYFRAL